MTAKTATSGNGGTPSSGGSSFVPGGIDHLVVCVKNLDVAKSTYEKLGFTTTPQAMHPWGTGNRLVQLQGCFIELLTVLDPWRIPDDAPGKYNFGSFNNVFLEKREGFSMLVLASDDAAGEQKRLAAAGIGKFELFRFERKAKLPDRSEKVVAFSLAFAADGRMPEAGFFFCQQHNPDFFWKPAYQRHGNTAQGIEEVVMLADAPPTLGDFFAKLCGMDAVEPDLESLAVETKRGRVTLLTPEAHKERFPGCSWASPQKGAHFTAFRVKVADLDKAQTMLALNEVPFEKLGNRLLVAPEHAHNVAVEYVA